MKKTAWVAGMAVALIAGLGGAGIWCARHHVVRTERGTVVLGKRFMTLADSFPDVRGWTTEDFEAHPELTQALEQGGYGDLLEELRARERMAKLEAAKTKAAELAADAADAMAETAGAVAETAGEWAGKAADAAGELSEQAAEKVAELSSWLEEKTTRRGAEAEEPAK